MSPLVLRWKMFLLFKKRACRRLGGWERTVLAARPESMVRIRDTSYFMSFYQEDGQEYGLCGASETAELKIHLCATIEATVVRPSHALK